MKVDPESLALRLVVDSFYLLIKITLQKMDKDHVVCVMEAKMVPKDGAAAVFSFHSFCFSREETLQNPYF